MMIKRIAALLLVLVLALPALFSCARGGSDTEGSGTAAVSGTDEQTANNTETDARTESPETDVQTEAPETNAPETDDVMAEPETEIINIVALGDSIAAGYGLASPEAERYSHLIKERIDARDGFECIETNCGVNGQTSGGLIESFASLPPLDGTDYVTVSIGANNVLGPAVDMFAKYGAALLIEDEDLRAAAFSSAYKEFNAATAAGIEQFKKDLPEIISAIKRAAPEAEIIFQTIYNPYNNVSLTLTLGDVTVDLNTDSDRLVSALNDIIESGAVLLDYKVADVYTAFETETGVVNAEGGGLASAPLALDPHPTAKGHGLIADVIISFIDGEAAK